MIPRFTRKFQRTNDLDGQTFDRELSPLALERGVVINQDRSLGYGFRLDPPYTPTLSDEGVEGIYAALGGFLNALPEHFDVQVIWTQHSRTAEFSARLAAMEFSAGLVGEVQREQQDNLLALLREGHLRWIEVYLILVRKLPGTDRALRRQDGGERTPAPRPVDVAQGFLAGARERFHYDREQFAAAAAELPDPGADPDRRPGRTGLVARPARRRGRDPPFLPALESPAVRGGRQPPAPRSAGGAVHRALRAQRFSLGSGGSRRARRHGRTRRLDACRPHPV